MNAMPQLGLWVFSLFLALPLWCQGVYGDNTTCVSTALDWYTNAVGETPCVTYQRLRQICNNDYQVQKFRSSTPGDNCNDQLSACCCNSISWALSMLCMNCQYSSGGNGIDAGNGAYELYLGSCSPSRNQTLPNDIQAAVCNKEIKIDRSLYELFWASGAWFYVYTQETIVTDLAASNNNTFTHCTSTTKNDTTTSAAPTSTSPSTPSSSPSSSSDSNTGAIAGGVVGGVVGALAIGLVLFFFWRRGRRSQGPRPLDLARESHYEDGGDPPMGMITPFSPSPTSRSGPESLASGSAGGGRYALVDRSVANVAKFAGVGDGYPPSPQEEERHADAGPVPYLQRSVSGRLPPAYRSWDDPPAEMEAALQWDGPTTPPAELAAGPSAAIPHPLPAIPTDVKRPVVDA